MAFWRFSLLNKILIRGAILGAFFLSVTHFAHATSAPNNLWYMNRDHYDDSGNGQDNWLNGSATSSGKFAGESRFLASATITQIPAININRSGLEFGTSTSYSVHAWFNFPDLTNPIVWTQGANQVGVRVISGNLCISNNSVCETNIGAVATNTWEEVDVAYDKTNFQVTAWLNGTKTVNATGTTPASVIEYLGGRNGISTSNGYIEDFATWKNYQLTDTDVSCYYASNVKIPSDGSCSGGAPSISALEQYKSDATTTIPQGATTNETKVVFGATLAVSGTSSGTLEVQLATSTANFTDNQVNASSSSPVSSGSIATTSISNLAHGDYFWRARTIDSSNQTSTWEAFGVSSTVDFTVASATPPSFPFQIDSDNTLTTGLVSYWKLNENIASGERFDSYGPNNLLDATGNIATGTGPGIEVPNIAANFGASNSTKYLYNASDLGIASGSVTFTGWVKSESGNGNPSWLIGSRTQPPDNDIDQGITAEGTADMRVKRLSNTNDSVSNSVNIEDGNWHFVAFRWDGSTIWGNVDSSTVVTVASSHTTGNGNSSNLFLLGSHPTAPLQNWSGLIADVGVWSRKLSNQEISDLYDGGHGDAFSGLAQYKSDAATTIPQNGTTTESSVIFGSTLYPIGTSTLQLQVEVEPASTTFTDTPNATSTYVSSGTLATAIFTSSTAINPSVYPRDPESWSNGSFHWQARVIASSTGATSTWQLFGATSTATDFKIKTVPLYTQEASNYPSFSSSSVWASSTYDDALPGTQCGSGVNSSTIEACGCAISSVVMWLRSFGISSDTLGEDVNPETLNNWLVNNNGYSSTSTGGVLFWPAVQHYASSSDGGDIAYDVNHTAASTTIINSLLASSTPDPVILFEDNVPDGSATTTHFVVATGFANYAGTSTYTIRDSFWYNTQYLNQATSTGTASTIKGYRNNINGMHIYYDPPQDPVVNEYIVNEPNALILVDSQGRRTGKDPNTGTLYHEIPNTSYVEEATSPGHPNGELFVSDLSNGQYTLYVLGGRTGSYALDAWLDDWQHRPSSQGITGNIQVGSMIAYEQNYDSANFASSTFSFAGSGSSTVSITSAPAHNLPPPPVSTLPAEISPPPKPPPFYPPSSPTSTPSNASSSSTSSSTLL
jgi:hypothetical protein